MRALVAAAAAALLVFPAGPAHAGPPGSGLGCGVVSVTSTADPDDQVGVISGGPITGATGGRLYCVVGSATGVAGADRHAVGDVVAVPPTSVVYEAKRGEWVSICTMYEDAAGTFWSWSGNRWVAGRVCLAAERVEPTVDAGLVYELVSRTCAVLGCDLAGPVPVPGAVYAAPPVIT